MNIFITGGTSGMGLALAKHYLEAGHRVGICGRSLSKLPEHFRADHPKLICYEVDVADALAIRHAIYSFAENGLDLLIASAGRSVGKKSRWPNLTIAREIIDINVVGMLNTVEPALEIMQKQKSGHLALFASVSGMVGLPGAGFYSASKAFVLKLCESFALDLPEYGINVTAIAPGFVDTPLTRRNDHKMPFLVSDLDAAKIIARGIEKKMPLLVFPWQMKVVMYILERMPRFLYRRVMKIKLLNYSS